jgi:hypothetical protein
MVTRVEAAIGPDRRISHWNYEVWSNSHNNRPVDAGGYAVAQEIVPGFSAPAPKPIPMPEGDGDRNANPLYVLPNMNVRYHFVPEMPLRVSALRSLGAHLNVFTIESVLDELALAGGVDPLAFRLAHMQDARARAVMIEAANRFGWARRPRGDGRRGCGMAFARYKNIGAYCALAMEIEVERETGEVTVHRIQAAVDAGQPASPDGIRNQVEGGIIQSLSWAMCEAVTYDATHRTSFDWGTYPILRFENVPGSIDVHVMDRPGEPFLGAGETAQGPTSAALANAIADATGARLRDMPLTPGDQGGHRHLTVCAPGPVSKSRGDASDSPCGCRSAAPVTGHFFPPHHALSIRGYPRVQGTDTSGSSYVGAGISPRVRGKPLLYKVLFTKGKSQNIVGVVRRP